MHSLAPSHLLVTPRPTAGLRVPDTPVTRLEDTSSHSMDFGPRPAILVLTSVPLGAPAWCRHPCPAASAVLSALCLCLSFRSQGRGCWQVSHGQRTLSVLCPSSKPMARNTRLHACVHSFLHSPVSSPSRCLLARGHCISLAAHAPWGTPSLGPSLGLSCAQRVWAPRPRSLLSSPCPPLTPGQGTGLTLPRHML